MKEGKKRKKDVSKDGDEGSRKKKKKNASNGYLPV